MNFNSEDNLFSENLMDEDTQKFWEKIDELSHIAEEHSKSLNETSEPEFNSIEEARKYYNSISFLEWENNMREKYGV